MKRKAMIIAALLLGPTVAVADTFKEVTVGIPVPSISDAEEWYGKFFGADTEVMRPVPGVVEYHAAPGVWVQIYEGPQISAGAVRFLVDDIDSTQQAFSEAGIDTGEAIEVPGVVTYSEFVDPFGNNLGFYDLP